MAAAATTATAAGQVESSDISSPKSNGVSVAAEAPVTNEPDSEEDAAAEEDAEYDDEEEGEEEEEELEEDDEDFEEEDDEVEASDDESVVGKPQKSSNSSSSNVSNIANASSTVSVSAKRDSIASSTSSKSSTKTTSSQSNQNQRAKSKGGDAAQAATFKTRVFTNKSVQNKKQQNKNQSQQQRKNSNEGNKLKGSVLLIEEMFQPATRKASMQRAAKKVAEKEAATSTVPSPSSSSGDEQQGNKNKNKASRNFTHPQPVVVGAAAAAAKCWSRQSQTTFTGTSNASKAAKAKPKSAGGDSPNSSPQGSTVHHGQGVHKKASSCATTTSTATSASTLHQYKKLNLSDEQLVRYLHHYLLDVDSLKLLGFPVECEWSSDRAVIYKPSAAEFYSMRQQQRQPTDTVTATSTVIPVTVEKAVPKEEEEDLVDDGIVTDELDLKLDEESEEDEEEDEEEDDDDDEEEESGEESKGSSRRTRRSALNRLTSVKLLSSSPPSSSSGNSSGIEDSSESASSLPGSPSMDMLEAIPAADEKKCSRCGRGFFVTVDGEYLTQEHCVFHYGRVQRVLNKVDNSFSFEYSCCAASPDTKGCTMHKLHVWSGLSEGCNGPYHGFVSTSKRSLGSPDNRKSKLKVKRKLSDGPSFVFCADLDHLEGVTEEKKSGPRSSSRAPTKTVGVFALDCEMCFTGRGLELAKVTVVAHDGSLVYEKFVQPESEIIDYNTRFSGIKPSDFHPSNRKNIRSIREVQRDLMEFIGEDTILIGHGLENDLRALKLIHKRIIDTSIAFPHFSGLPFRRSLKSLTKTILKRDIQTCQTGHDSYEDSLACVELMLWRVRKDFRTSAAGHNGHNHHQAYQQQSQEQQMKRFQGPSGAVRWS